MSPARLRADASAASPWTATPATLRVSHEQAPSPSPAAFAASAFIKQYCLACHNDRAKIGGLSLTEVDLEDVGGHAELWEKVLHKVDTRQMPPADRPQPPASQIAALTSWLETTLDGAAAAHPDPGRVAIHRLNRTEYANAVRDLLALDIDTKALLLPDETDDGFDNVAASLALSPAHLERYLNAARTISRLALDDPALGEAPASATYRVPKLLTQDVRVSEELPFGSRGGLVARHHFPLDGEYDFKIRLRRQVYDYIVGMGHAQALDLRIDGERVKRFTVGGEATGTPGPLTWNGEIVGDTEWELYMHAADANLQVKAPVKAGSRIVTLSFVDSPWEEESATQPLLVDFLRGADEQYDGYAAVDALTILGPYAAGRASTPTASRNRVFVCWPQASRNARSEEDACARTILTRLGQRAYRRPLAPPELDTLLDFYQRGRSEGSFEHGIQSALERILVSFNFLFRVGDAPVRASKTDVARLSDVALASRLSFFLWSSIPDEGLLDLAIRGELGKPAVLEGQVRRMLRDPKANALVESFASQWLGIRKAHSWQPDPNIYPQFDENLRAAFLQETTLFLTDQFRQDRSILNLITADYSFVNERLAQHYGLRGVLGERFRKVSFSDGRRGGLLGQGGILMVTSYPDRTAPVLRGFWVLDNLLGIPPPPPPPNIPDLEPTAADGRTLSMREQMEQHRKNPACAACHVRMDPLGFALENFDAIGGWRAESLGIPVDVSATFADGTALEGVQGLRRFVVKRPERYAHTFAAKMMTYALGRHVDHRDQPALRRLVRDAAASGYRWSDLVLGIVRSSPFQMRKSTS